MHSICYMCHAHVKIPWAVWTLFYILDSLHVHVSLIGRKKKDLMCTLFSDVKLQIVRREPTLPFPLRCFAAKSSNAYKIENEVYLLNYFCKGITFEVAARSLGVAQTK